MNSYLKKVIKKRPTGRIRSVGRWNIILNHSVGSSDHLSNNHFLVVIDV